MEDALEAAKLIVSAHDDPNCSVHAYMKVKNKALSVIGTVGLARALLSSSERVKEMEDELARLRSAPTEFCNGPHAHFQERAMATIETTETAKDAVRKDFNPSGNPDVAEIKAITASLISKMEGIRDRDGGKAGREAAVAITNVQTASMWCVLAATKGL